MIPAMDRDTATQALRTGASWPRHKRRKRGRARRRPAAPPPEPSTNYEGMAARLVLTGARTVVILDHPHRFTTHTRSKA